MPTPTLPLRKHQAEGIAWIRNVKRGLLADEPGLGKTRQAIEAFDHLPRKLVVAPKLVLEGGTWEDELNRWSANPSSWTITTYTSLNRRKQKGERASTTAPIKVLNDHVKGKWDAVVFDEAHYLKGRDTLWTWAALQIARKAEYFLPMTGTPFPNWAHEIFMILRMLYPEEGKQGRGGDFSGFWGWAEQWFDCKPSRFSKGFPVAGELLGCSRSRKQLKECLARPAADPCEHYLAFAEANLGGHYLRRWRDDVLDLPPLETQRVQTPMDAATKKMYLSLKNEFYAQYEGQEILAWNQGAKNVQLHKATTSPWLLTMQGEPRGGKLELLKYDLSNRTRPTLVFAHYKDSVEACAAVARKLGASVGIVHGDIPSATRVESFKRFKSGNIDVLCGSLETMSEGHTLVQADMAIFVEKSFKPYRNTQAVNRCYRMGQERPVMIREYLTPNSVDMKKERLLAVKNDRQMRALTAAEFGEII